MPQFGESLSITKLLTGSLRVFGISKGEDASLVERQLLYRLKRREGVDFLEFYCFR